MFKKLLFISAIGISSNLFAQAPQKMSYQAVVRNASNNLVASAPVGMRLSILQNSPTGTPVYVETQTTSTNVNGLVSLVIGNGTVVNGSISTIDWSTGIYYIKSETDPLGGSNYTIVGTSQLLSVPYALYAENGGTPGPTGPQGPIGLTGPTGATGSEGQGVPTGGLANQVLSKVDGTDFNTAWITPNNGMSGNVNFIPRFSGTNTISSSILQSNNISFSINTSIDSKLTFHTYKEQQTSDGDGQYSMFASRQRNTQNNGTGYDRASSNAAFGARNVWGDEYTFGMAGYSDNDYTRTGGVLGANSAVTSWAVLGYKNSASVNYAVYGSSNYIWGSGLLPQSENQGIGGGFFGGVVGSISKGQVIGQLNAGELFATYNSGNTYTLGKNIELVKVNETISPVYSVTGLTAKMYDNGTAQLVNGEAFVAFDSNYKLLLGENPTVTVTPNGNCNGVYISSVTKEGFTVKEINNGTHSVAVSWISVGNRIDERIEEATKLVSQPNFERNVQQVLFDDGNRDGKAMGIWWDGQTVRFGEMPASLTIVDASDRK